MIDTQRGVADNLEMPFGYVSRILNEGQTKSYIIDLTQNRKSLQNF